MSEYLVERFPLACSSLRGRGCSVPLLNALSLLIRNLGGRGWGGEQHTSIMGTQVIGYMVEPTYENKLPN